MTILISVYFTFFVLALGFILGLFLESPRQEWVDLRKRHFAFVLVVLLITALLWPLIIVVWVRNMFRNTQHGGSK